MGPSTSTPAPSMPSGPPSRRWPRLFATQASAILTDARAESEGEQLALKLQGALRTREVIAQAQGVVMERDGVSADEAFAVLNRGARRDNCAVRRCALDVVGSTHRDSSARAGDGPVAEQIDVLEQARRDVGLSHRELWFRYFELGGMSTAFEVEAYLYGALTATVHDRDLIAVVRTNDSRSWAGIIRSRIQRLALPSAPSSAFGGPPQMLTVGSDGR